MALQQHLACCSRGYPGQGEDAAHAPDDENRFRRRLWEVRQQYYKNMSLDVRRARRRSRARSTQRPRTADVPQPMRLIVGRSTATIQEPFSPKSEQDTSSDDCKQPSLSATGAAGSSQEWAPSSSVPGAEAELNSGPRSAAGTEAPGDDGEWEGEGAQRSVAAEQLAAGEQAKAGTDKAVGQLAAPDDKQEVGDQVAAQERVKKDRYIRPGTTTLCVRNIPARYTHEHLLHAWTDHRSFDFLLHPYSFVHKRNLGYVLINFVSPEAAMGFYRRWHGSRFDDHGHARDLDIVMGEVQGYAALVRNFGNKIRSVKNPHILPVLLADGKPLDAQAVVREAAMFRYQ